MSRDNWAMYGEWLFPIFKTLEATRVGPLRSL